MANNHGVVMPTENERCVSGDVVMTMHVVDERTLEAKMLNGEGDRVWSDRTMHA